MRKTFYHFILAAVVMIGHTAEARSVSAKITVGSKTSDGVIVSRNKDLITFRAVGMSGDVSYPADAIKAVHFPVEIDKQAVSRLLENRMHAELCATLEAALRPFVEYSDLPSNLVEYQAVLMELYYKAGDFERSMSYSSKLQADERNPELRKKAMVYQGLALLGAGRLSEAEALFTAQGWADEPGEDASAEDLYITASFLFMKKEYLKAIETASKVIAFHSQDPDWMRPAELLCAQIYLELARTSGNPDFLDSADEVIREIGLLYSNTDEADQAGALKLKVNALRLEMPAKPDEEDESGR